MPRGADALSSPPRLDVPLAGGTLAAFELTGGTPDLPLALAVHGITANSRSWVPVARALDGRAHLIAVDLRGRGRSNALPGPFGIAAHAADLIAVLDHLGADRAVLVGHSLGAYIVARAGVDHPERAVAAVLVDGGLTIPGSQDVDPLQFLPVFLGPSLARLKMTFSTREEYYAWFASLPAFDGGKVTAADLRAYTDHDLVATGSTLRSSVSEAAVRTDGAEVLAMGDVAHHLTIPAILLCAPRGLQDEPHPMQPLALAEAWAAERPGLRHVQLVGGVNHYTITLGATGAATVASTIATLGQ